YAKGKSQVRTYSVADLVIPVENHPSPLCMLHDARWKAAIDNQLHGGNYNAGTQPYAGPMALQGGLPVGNPSGAGGNGHAGSQVPKPEPGQSIEELLIRTITHTIAPDSWAEVGGKGTIQYFPLGLALVINQTQDIQEQIVELLSALRRL